MWREDDSHTYGKGLLQLSVSRLNDLFASSASNKARNQKEGKLMMIHDDDNNDDDFDDDDDDDDDT